jgi:hypothetical protein
MFRSSGTKISAQVNNPFKHVFEEFFERGRAAVRRKRDKVLIALNEKILAATPVWEGDTILNWRWSTWRRICSTKSRAATISAGVHTNEMPLGDEPRRAINEERPRRSLTGALKAKKPVDIYLTNTSDSAVALEYGLLPDAAVLACRRVQGHRPSGDR